MKSQEFVVQETSGFVDAALCQSLRDAAGSRLTTARTVGKQVTGARVAQYCWIGDLARTNPGLRSVLNRISVLSGLPLENQEAPHVVKYDVGGEYKHHYDSFDDKGPDVQRGGNRTHSFLVYLNDDFRGGGTEFPHLHQRVKPELGKLVWWRNLDDKGQRLESSKHAGLPVEEGTKWILVVWVRQRKFG